MSYTYIETDVADGIARLTFNRPQQLNAFNNDLMRETLAAMAQLNGDDAVDSLDLLTLLAVWGDCP